MTGLTNGTAYVFRVAAVNAVGTGSYTAASSAVTPGAFSLTRAASGPFATATGDGTSGSQLVWSGLVSTTSLNVMFTAAAAGTLNLSLTLNGYGGDYGDDLFQITKNGSVVFTPATGSNVTRTTTFSVASGDVIRLNLDSQNAGNLTAFSASVTPSATFTATAVLLTSATSYTVPAGATSMKAWAVGSGGRGDGGGGAGGTAVKTWSVSGGQSVAYVVGPARTGGQQAGANSTITFSGTTITGNGGGATTGGGFSGGDGGADGGSAGGSCYESFSGAVGGNQDVAGCQRKRATDVSGLFAALALAGISTTQTCGTTGVFGSGGYSGKYGPFISAGIGGGGRSVTNLCGEATGSGSGAVVLLFN